MGQQYQDPISSFAASPQATEPQQQSNQNAGNNTPGKSIEQSPMHDGFGTRSGMYDNGMDVSAQPAPVATPPQPQNQPASAGVNPSWAQQGRKRGGRAKRADGGPLAAFGSMADQPMSMMRTGDTVKAFGNPFAAAQAPAQPVPQNVPPAMTSPAGISSVNTDTFPVSTAAANAPSWKASNPDEETIGQLYQRELGRAPDPGGLEYWVKQLQSGITPEAIDMYFQASPEFRNRAYQAQQNVLQNQLGAGVHPDAPGMMDPSVAMYNARMANAQNLYGGIAQQNAAQNMSDQSVYQQQLEKVQAANQQRLAEAQQAKSNRQAREAAEANARAIALMFMLRH